MVKLREIVGYLRRVASEPVGELGRWQGYLRFCSDLGLHSMRTLKRVRVGQMTAALTYRTIFSLVPILVLGLIVYSSFVEQEQARGMFKEQVYSFFNMDVLMGDGEETGDAGGAGDKQEPKLYSGEVEVHVEGEGLGKGGAGDNGEGQAIAGQEVGSKQGGEAVGGQEVNAGGQDDKDDVEAKVLEAKAAAAGALASRRRMHDTIEEKIDELMDNASSIEFGRIGVVGFLLLIWSGVALIVSLEQCFNTVYQVGKGRSLVSRFVMYWAVLTLGPVLLAMSLGTIEMFFKEVSGFAVIGGVFVYLSKFAGVLSSWLLLLMLFMFLPNAKVKFRAALVGSGISAVMWELVRWGFRIYVKKAVTINVLYGSLGLIPLFLLGVYMTWWVVLLGLQITYTLQTIRGFRIKRDEGLMGDGFDGDPMRVVHMMIEIGRGFVKGKAVSRGELSREMGCGLEGVDGLSELLLNGGYIHEVKGGGYAVSEPLEKIVLGDLLNLGSASSCWRGRVLDDEERELYRGVIAAGCEKLGDRTLGDVLG